MKFRGGQDSVGLTMTELLVVLVVISLLATIALPVYTNQSERARFATAQLECKMIADAMEACGAVHSFYVPIQVLDDLPASDQLDQGNQSDSIENESSIFLVDFNKPLSDLGNDQPDLTEVVSDARVRNLVERWQGPFLNPNRVYVGDAANQDPDNLDGRLQLLDHPLDPWGNPYRFYSPEGIVGSAANNTDPNSWQNTNFSNGLINSGNDRFDRYAIVSFGPDGVADNQNLSDDNNDIIYFFGSIVGPRDQIEDLGNGNNNNNNNP